MGIYHFLSCIYHLKCIRAFVSLQYLLMPDKDLDVLSSKRLSVPIDFLFWANWLSKTEKACMKTLMTWLFVLCNGSFIFIYIIGIGRKIGCFGLHINLSYIICVYIWFFLFIILFIIMTTNWYINNKLFEFASEQPNCHIITWVGNSVDWSL